MARDLSSQIESGSSELASQRFSARQQSHQAISVTVSYAFLIFSIVTSQFPYVILASKHRFGNVDNIADQQKNRIG